MVTLKTFMVGISKVEDRYWRIKSCIEQNEFMSCHVGYIAPLQEQNLFSQHRS